MKSKIAVITVTIYLVIVCIFANAESFSPLSEILYLLSPAILVTMVIVIVKDNSRPYPELGDQEWGYRDKNKGDLEVL